MKSKWIEYNGKKILYPNGRAEIRFTLSNQGKGDAYNLVFEIKDLNEVKGIQFKARQAVPLLAAGKQTVVIIPVIGKPDLVTGDTNFKITIIEGNGFDADPFYVNFKTQGKDL